MGSHRRLPFVVLLPIIAAALTFGFAGTGAGAPTFAASGHGMPLLAATDWGQGQAVLGARSETETLGSGTITTGRWSVAGTGGTSSVATGAGRCRVRLERAVPPGLPASCGGTHLRSPPG
jgi:hypothetical protein